MNTNKIDLIKAEVEKLKSQLLRGDCSSQIAMETMCKEEAYNEVLAILDAMQEEPEKIKKGCKYRCLSDMVNKDTGNIAFIGDKIYLAPKDNTLVSEENGWLCDTSEDASNFELVEEPVSEDLEIAANEWDAKASFTPFYMALDDNGNPNGVRQDYTTHAESFKAGAKWQKEKEYTCYEEAFEDGAKWKVENLWKPADGDDLPEIDREVIAILDNGKVGFAHRPNPNGWDGKSLTTGEVEHYTPKTYDKGGWNIPDVKYWLDCSLANMED